MKQVTRYIANDGREFFESYDCLEYEHEQAEVKEIIDKLHPRPASGEFTSGEGYIQHSPEIFVWVRAELEKIAQRHTVLKSSGAGRRELIGRLIDDMGIRHLSRAWYRINCTDEQLREWGQPYYAAHPREGKAIRLN